MSDKDHPHKHHQEPQPQQPQHQQPPHQQRQPVYAPNWDTNKQVVMLLTEMADTLRRMERNIQDVLSVIMLLRLDQRDKDRKKHLKLKASTTMENEALLKQVRDEASQKFSGKQKDSSSIYDDINYANMGISDDQDSTYYDDDGIY